MDVAIVGCGVSGLLLAEAVLAEGAAARVYLVGPHAPPRAHRLSFWHDGPTPFDPHVDASFAAVGVVGADSATALGRLGRLTYRTFRAQDWAEAARRRLLASPRVTWVPHAAEGWETQGARARVRAGPGALEADWAFVSGHLPAAEPALWQRFRGWEVELDGRPPAPGEATLMDFRTGAGPDLRFMYALPLGGRRLFVEHVSYGPCDHRAALDAYLRGVVGAASWRVLDEEAGATPLFRDPPRDAPGRVLHIGVAGGLAKATTGYALTRMWRDARAIAGSLARRGRPPRRRRRPLLGRLADHFFVDVARRDPASLPAMMGALFGRAPADAVLSFLDDRASLREALSVARAMPGWIRWLLGLGPVRARAPSAVEP